MHCFVDVRRSTVVLLASATGFLAACSDSPTAPVARAPRGIVVLNGFGAPGLTLLADTGSATASIPFGAAFDGGGMTLERDTVLATSSSLRGDQLYVASITTGTLLRVQLPVRSNPAGATFTQALGASAGTANVAVALRDSQAVALVRATGEFGSVVTTLRGVGRCPYDVGVHGGALWVVDANLNCGAGFVSQGDARLIRLSASGAGARDTVTLAGIRNATSLTIVGDAAYVTSAGVADFSAFPITVFTTPGSITRVDLTARRVVRTVSLPTGTYGAGLRAGADGNLYVTAYTRTDFSRQDVFAFDAVLAPVGARAAGAQSLDLRLATGGAPVCSAATADALGRVYCAANGAGSQAVVHVFERTGALLRSVPAGQGAVDLAVR